jgi:L-alanine-DL-glutamate epimerase-like enolase superfamily enzyme
MKITDIKLQIVEIPGRHAGTYELVQVPTVRRIQYTHHAKRTDRPAQDILMRVQTDEGVEGICTVDNSLLVGPPQTMVDLLRSNVIGEDPFHREKLFQKLHLGTRWVYQKPGWFGAFDNCLWDIAGKVAGLPIYALLGKVRDGVPIYQTAGDGPVEMYIEHIEQGKALGIRAYKPHSYKGGKADIPIMERLREHVGPDYDLILDPVCSYSLREAIEVGRVLEELDFVWLEEPFHEQKMHHYQELCAELTIPVVATEMLMYDMNLSAQWLIQGATDRLRANARHGTTQVLKMAHMAELYGTNIELNGVGGIYGLVHTHLGCAIANNDYFELGVGGGWLKAGQETGMANPPQIVNGCLVPPDGPGWGAEWDMAFLQSRTVAML